MHPTITRMQEVVAKGDDTKIAEILAEDVTFMPPTYFATWIGRAPVAAVLGHVGQVFSDFKYRRVMGDGHDWALEFQCKIGDLDAVGVDLITLNDDGLIQKFEVVMRPYKTIGALRDAMMTRISTDPRFQEYRKALA
ncbi:nuclear transport factor 2 family protein [Sedimentitalea nanhaiensis]|uniref:SnoaL-like domain-containing protein n=1 Tax=Sedimentitalea nanhaiensis TaxID=999627 RepID=A0A1I7BZN1_9RHOB|nr:nuclear transport factor 2 family protein [Sedimentitalea nanhaiensis]SFT92636.1 SnoaL-like domain-containing protein [Sedimentitalea nanhaiensis]